MMTAAQNNKQSEITTAGVIQISYKCHFLQSN